MSGALPSWARKGVKVVCVDDVMRRPKLVGIQWLGDLDGLQVGAVYTIRAALPDWFDGTPVLHLEEIHRPPLPDEDGETGFALDRFRPLVSTKTEADDVALFKRVAHTPNPALQRDFSPYPRERA